MRKQLYRLSDAEWKRIEPLMPRGRRGAHRVDDRRIISGMMHMLRSGARWRDCPPDYGPYTTVYNRFNRWSRQGIWTDIFYFYALTGSTGMVGTMSIDSTHIPAPPRNLWTRLRFPRRLLADRAYDAKSLRDWLAERRVKAVIPPNPTRKHPHAYDAKAYKLRNLIERMFCRLKDFRRIATRYDKRADVYLSAILLAA